MALTSKHHTIIQSLLTRGPLPEPDFHSLFSLLTTHHPAKHRKVFDECLLRINKELGFLQFEVRGCRNQYDGSVWYGLVNNVSDDVAKMGTRFSLVQVAFYKAVEELIIHDGTNQGFVTSIDALNIRLENQVKTEQSSQDGISRIPYAVKSFTMSDKEKTLNALVEDQWLCYTSHGNIGFGTRSFLDLRSWFHSNEVHACDVCNEAAIKAYACPKDGCPVRIHDYCLTNKFPHGKIARACPSCSTSWSSADVDEEEPVSRKRIRRCNAKYVDTYVDTRSSKFSTKQKTTKTVGSQTRRKRCKAEEVNSFLSQNLTEAPWGLVPRRKRSYKAKQNAKKDVPPSMPPKNRNRRNKPVRDCIIID